LAGDGAPANRPRHGSKARFARRAGGHYSESAMSDALAWAIFGATIVALAVFLAVLIRERRTAEQRFLAAVRELTTQMGGLVEELRAAVDAGHDDDRHAGIIGELAGTIDLDEVLARVLEAAAAARGVDAALVTIAGTGDEKPIVSTTGLSSEEADLAVSAPLDGRTARAVTVAYEYPDEAETNGGDLIRHGVAVPIPGDGGSLGYLVVFSRAPGHAFAEAEKRSLEDLATRAGPAIENARRFREARQLADLDALTGLHNRRYFHETLAREVARAQRYDRRLALVIFDLDGFKAINDRIGHLAGDGVLAEVAERVRSVVRSADVACRVGGDEFAVILPESTLADAEQLSQRMQAAVAADPIGQAGTLHVSAGAAELVPEDDATRLFERADRALYHEKQARGVGRRNAEAPVADEPA
jgi:diguanylate cyclase (GGDEF)-like protein